MPEELEEDEDGAPLPPNSPSMRYGYGPSVFAPPHIPPEPKPSRAARWRLRRMQWQDDMLYWWRHRTHWWERIQWDRVGNACIAIFIMALVAVVVIGIANSILVNMNHSYAKTCQAKAEKMEVAWYYDPTVYCMVKVQGRWYPLDSLQFVMPGDSNVEPTEPAYAAPGH